MNQAKPDFLNFQVDHMTMLMTPEMYNVYYAVSRVLFGLTPDDVIYEKRKEWVEGTGERSLTYALQLGEGQHTGHVQKTMMAAVQPSEPDGHPSHVRNILAEHRASSHWQHIALATPDLIRFHKHAEELGIRFITPLLQDEHEDVIQVFSGEWFAPGQPPSGLFFEFVQRTITPELIKKLEERNRESLFRDKTFLGLYSEKEKESQGGDILPFIDFDLHDQIFDLVGKKNQWEITEDDIGTVESMMRTYAQAHPDPVVRK